jgi:hypothetical protein
MEGYPIGLCVGLALGLSLAGDVSVNVSSEFEDAANAQSLTSETFCQELMQDNGFVAKINDALKYQQIKITNMEDCKATFIITPK